MSIKKTALLLAGYFVLNHAVGFAQETSYVGKAASIHQEKRPWNAQWIGAKDSKGTEYGVFYFRKNIVLKEKPATFNIHVSADNRYKLYVNGTLVSLGPARGDTYYW